jgi:hypothetical protein
VLSLGSVPGYIVLSDSIIIANIIVLVHSCHWPLEVVRKISSKTTSKSREISVERVKNLRY